MLRRLLAIILAAAWALRGISSAMPELFAPALPASPEPCLHEADGPLLGVWVPYMSLAAGEDTPAGFKANFRAIVREAESAGLNALFVHVRPFCDALYPSKLFPWSHILTGEQGKSPGFDPLEFMVECAHSAGMEFHAWINPLRVKTAETPGKLSPGSPYEELRREQGYYFMEWEGGVYLNPAYPYVRTLIADGVKEIAGNYPVDGIHFDDYFYPAADPSLDEEAYALYVAGADTPLSLSEWRQANISAMVQEVYMAAKAAGVSFGISPQGNILNDEEMGADVKSWCGVQGYADYLCPQLYYSFENPALSYGEALEEWKALPRHEGLKLYAGLALYKAGSEADSGTWLSSDDNIKRQIDAALGGGWDGVALYSSDYLTAEQSGRETANALEALARYKVAISARKIYN